MVYEYGIAQGIRDGWLSPLSSKATKTTIDVSGVGKRGGEFIAEQLEAAASRSISSNGACDEIVELQAPTLVVSLTVSVSSPCRTGARRTACARHQCQNGSGRDG